MDHLKRIFLLSIFHKISYELEAVVFFDGYPNEVQRGTKIAERMRRSRKNASADVLYNNGRKFQI